ncbi:hypothetical protein Poly41_14710 [Novipirellula artificiosorum]|uniref:UPF0316 protein Poly41_14710 n=1 Tax=Novipirellula artificiosorum TaxID=2528016 RepID=A0A5C6DXS3_9BACT|nr:hypothetical protein Poly41_14710 [Novipirellula artificiosorum]
MPWFIPVLIFLARVCDVSLGTLRTILMITGHRAMAVVLGVAEVTIWIFAVGGVMKYLSHPLAVVAYAGGFGSGVLVGMLLEEKLALGYRIVRVISNLADVDVSNLLRAEGYRVTRVDGTGMLGPVEIAFTVIRRKQLSHIRKLLKDHAPKAFLSVERVEVAQSGQTLATDSRFGQSLLGRIVVRK